MRRVGDEAAELLLGRLTRLERGLDVAEHRVERQPEAAHLGSLRGHVDAPREVACGDGGCGRSHRVQRPETAPDEPETEHGDPDEDADGHEQLDHEQAMERAVDVGK